MVKLGFLKKMLVCVALLSTSHLVAEERGHTTQLNGINLWWQDYGDSSHPAVLLIMGLIQTAKFGPKASSKALSIRGFM